MNVLNDYSGQSRAWWVVLSVGVAMVIAGFSYWFFPVMGYAVASVLFGWLLIAAGVVQLCVATGGTRPKYRVWWLIGGVIDMFIGFMLVRSVSLAEAVFPYFLACVFIFWGVSALATAVGVHRVRCRWLYIVNGILLLLIGFFFIDAGYIQNMAMVSSLTALAFIYWGFSIAVTGYELKPSDSEE